MSQTATEYFEPFSIRLPHLLDEALKPNSRASRTRHMAAVTSARKEGDAEARSQLGWDRPAHLEGSVISLRIVFYYPKDTPPQWTPDLDNLMAATKPYIDGIFDYLGDGGAIKVNDRQIDAIDISRVPVNCDLRETEFRFYDRRKLGDGGSPF